MRANLKKLRESFHDQEVELQQRLNQRNQLKEKVPGESGTSPDELENTLTRGSLEQSHDARAQDKDKSTVSNGVDVGSEDVALLVEDLEPSGVPATKVCLKIWCNVIDGLITGS